MPRKTKATKKGEIVEVEQKVESEPKVEAKPKVEVEVEVEPKAQPAAQQITKEKIPDKNYKIIIEEAAVQIRIKKNKKVIEDIEPDNKNIPEIVDLKKLIIDKLFEKSSCELALKTAQKMYEFLVMSHCEKDHSFQRNYLYERDDKPPIRVLVTDQDCKECDEIKSTYETKYIEFDIKCLDASIDALMEDITALHLGLNYKAYHEMSPVDYIKERSVDRNDRRQAMSLEKVVRIVYDEE